MLEEELRLLAATSFLFSREVFDQHFDSLFIDEGGQFALAHALAVGTAARNMIPLGDPNQLSQVSQGFHPARAHSSCSRTCSGTTRRCDRIWVSS